MGVRLNRKYFAAHQHIPCRAWVFVVAEHRDAGMTECATGADDVAMSPAPDSPVGPSEKDTHMSASGRNGNGGRSDLDSRQSAGNLVIANVL